MTKCILAGAAVVCTALGLSTLAVKADDQAPAAAPAAPAAPTLGPSMTGPLAANANPISFDLSAMPALGTVFGKTYVGGAVSGLGMWQDHVVPGVPGNTKTTGDLANGQVFIQKVDGFFQYFIEVGDYSLPTLGVPYLKSSQQINVFSPMPAGFVKLAPTDTLSVEVGKLPTLFGAEYAFTFENMNIERGVMWNQEPVFSNGAQINYAKGPLTVNVSVNDGYYSHHWSWISGAVTYAINSANSVEFVGGGNLSTKRTSTLATPPIQNNSQMYNLMYTYNSGPWTITPYIQYSHIEAEPFLGTTSGSTFGGALLAKYAFDSNFSLTGRGEYLSSTGNRVTGPNFLGYGPGSKVWTLTATPTYQYNIFFLRAEASYVKATDTTRGLVFGPTGTKTDQFRLVAETGVLF